LLPGKIQGGLKIEKGCPESQTQDNDPIFSKFLIHFEQKARTLPTTG
jgi:hypothetical protein